MNLIVAASSSATIPVLPSLLIVPTAGALVVAFLPRARKDLTKLVALIFSTITCALSLWLLSDFEYENHSDMFQFVSRQSWISDFGISWSFGCLLYTSPSPRD